MINKMDIINDKHEKIIDFFINLTSYEFCMINYTANICFFQDMTRVEGIRGLQSAINGVVREMWKEARYSLDRPRQKKGAGRVNSESKWRFSTHSRIGYY